MANAGSGSGTVLCLPVPPMGVMCLNGVGLSGTWMLVLWCACVSSLCLPVRACVSACLCVCVCSLVYVCAC